MENINFVYFDSEVVETFMPEEFDKISSGRLMDLIHNIKSWDDHDVLRAWKKHFIDLKIPFAIVERKGIKCLVKERRI